MAKLTQFENPLSGQKGSIFDFARLWSLILGVGIIFLVVNVGQRMAGAAASKLPGGIQAGFSQPLVNAPVAAGSTRRIYE